MTHVERRILDRQRIVQLERRLELYANFYMLWRELQRLKQPSREDRDQDALQVAAQNVVDAANELEQGLERSVTWGMPQLVGNRHV